MDSRIIQVQAAKQQQGSCHRCNQAVYFKEEQSCFLQPGYDLFPFESAAFRIKQMGCAATDARQKRYKNHYDTQTADPVEPDPPEQQAYWPSFNFRQCGSTGSSQS